MRCQLSQLFLFQHVKTTNIPEEWAGFRPFVNLMSVFLNWTFCSSSALINNAGRLIVDFGPTVEEGLLTLELGFFERVPFSKSGGGGGGGAIDLDGEVTVVTIPLSFEVVEDVDDARSSSWGSMRSSREGWCRFVFVKGFVEGIFPSRATKVRRYCDGLMREVPSDGDSNWGTMKLTVEGGLLIFIRFRASSLVPLPVAGLSAELSPTENWECLLVCWSVDWATLIGWPIWLPPPSVRAFNLSIPSLWSVETVLLTLVMEDRLEVRSLSWVEVSLSPAEFRRGCNGGGGGGGGTDCEDELEGNEICLLIFLKMNKRTQRMINWGF